MAQHLGRELAADDLDGRVVHGHLGARGHGVGEDSLSDPVGAVRELSAGQAPCLAVGGRSECLPDP